MTNTTTRIEHSIYGELDGVAVERFVLSSDTGLEVAILSHGAIVQELHVPDGRGERVNVVLGFDNLAQYGTKHPHFGSVIGRFANRIGSARFALDGVVYELTPNKGTFTAHGGARPFDAYTWRAEVVDTEHGPGVQLTHVSPDGDEGFPGELAGEGSGTVEDHLLTVYATHYTPTNDEQIPTGEIAPVAGTGLDFRQPRRIGDAVRDGDDRQIAIARGIDHNFVVDRPAGTSDLVPAARLEDLASGRVMQVFTTMPGMQVYTSNSLDGSLRGYSGRLYRQTDAICFETQQFPDAPNHPEFPSAVLRPGEEFRSTTIFQFSAAS